MSKDLTQALSKCGPRSPERVLQHLLHELSRGRPPSAQPVTAVPASLGQVGAPEPAEGLRLAAPLPHKAAALPRPSLPRPCFCLLANPACPLPGPLHGVVRYLTTFPVAGVSRLLAPNPKVSTHTLYFQTQPGVRLWVTELQGLPGTAWGHCIG